MRKRFYKRNVSYIAILAGFICFNFLEVCQSHAVPNGVGRGNACVRNKRLCDRDSVESRIYFKDVSQELFKEVFENDLAPVLELADQLPAFGAELRLVLKKSWRLDRDYRTIIDCPDLTSSYDHAGKKIACQSETAIVIYDPWAKSLKDQRIEFDFLLHELLLGIMVKHNSSYEKYDFKKIDSDNFLRLFEVFTKKPLPSVKELQVMLAEQNFGHYKTQEQMSAYDSFIDRAIELRSACDNAAGIEKETCLKLALEHLEELIDLNPEIAKEPQTIYTLESTRSALRKKMTVNRHFPSQ